MFSTIIIIRPGKFYAVILDVFFNSLLQSVQSKFLDWNAIY